MFDHCIKWNDKGINYYIGWYANDGIFIKNDIIEYLEEPLQLFDIDINNKEHQKFIEISNLDDCKKSKEKYFIKGENNYNIEKIVENMITDERLEKYIEEREKENKSHWIKLNKINDKHIMHWIIIRIKKKLPQNFDPIDLA